MILNPSSSFPGTHLRVSFSVWKHVGRSLSPRPVSVTQDGNRVHKGAGRPRRIRGPRETAEGLVGARLPL